MTPGETTINEQLAVIYAALLAIQTAMEVVVENRPAIPVNNESFMRLMDSLARQATLQSQFFTSLATMGASERAS